MTKSLQGYGGNTGAPSDGFVVDGPLEVKGAITSNGVPVSQPPVAAISLSLAAGSPPSSTFTQLDTSTSVVNTDTTDFTVNTDGTITVKTTMKARVSTQVNWGSYATAQDAKSALYDNGSEVGAIDLAEGTNKATAGVTLSNTWVQTLTAGHKYGIGVFFSAASASVTYAQLIIQRIQ